MKRHEGKCRLMRHDTLIRCFQTIEAMITGAGVTANELSQRLKVSRRTAYRYIDSASIVMPVVQSPETPARFKISMPSAHFGGTNDSRGPLNGESGRRIKEVIQNYHRSY